MIIKEIHIDHLLPQIKVGTGGRFSAASIAALAASIDHQGLLQPVCAAICDDGNIRLIAGARRVRAVQVLGWQTIICVVRYVCSEAEAVALAMAENLHRANPPAVAFSNNMTELLKALGSVDAVALELGLRPERVGKFVEPKVSVSGKKSVDAGDTTSCSNTLNAEPQKTDDGHVDAGVSSHHCRHSVDMQIAVVHDGKNSRRSILTANKNSKVSNCDNQRSCNGRLTCSCIPEKLREPIRLLIESFQEAQMVS